MKKRLIISATETTVSEYLVSVAPERGGEKEEDYISA